MLEENKIKCLDMIAYNNGYRRNKRLLILNPSLSYPKSRDAISSKNLTIVCSDCFIFINVNTKGFYMMEWR